MKSLSILRVLVLALMGLGAGFSVDVRAQQSSSDLLERYSNLKPYHQGMKVPMPVEVCESKRRGGKTCSIQIQMEDQPERLENLLSETERQNNVGDPAFLNSPLGKEYLALKNFLNINESLNACSAGKGEDYAGGRLSPILERLKANSASASVSGPCESYGVPDVLSGEPGELTSDVFDILSRLQPETEPSLPRESTLENQILSESIRKSLEANILFSMKFKGQDVASSSYRANLLNQVCGSLACSESESNYLKKQIAHMVRKVILDERKKGSDQASVNSSDSAFKDLYERVDSLNRILKSYNTQKADLEKQWAEEDQKYESISSGSVRGQTRARDMRRLRRKAELESLKSQTFSAYQNEYALLHASGAGDLLQTKVIRERLGIMDLEKMKGKLFGLAGYKTEALMNRDDFKLLRYPNRSIVNAAIGEALSRTISQSQELLSKFRNKRAEDQKLLDQIKNYPMSARYYTEEYKKDRMKSIQEFIKTSPFAVGSVLLKQPKHAELLCQASADMAKMDQYKDIAEMGIYVVVGGAIAVAGVATMGGALPAAAAIGTAVGAAAFTAADYTYQRHEKNRHFQLNQNMLNSYLSGVGDSKSIGDIRNEWQAHLKANDSANTALGFGVFDLMGLGAARRTGTVARAISSVDNFDVKIAQNQKLLNRIANNPSYSKSITNLLENHPREEVGEFLASIAKLSKDEIKTVFENPARYFALGKLLNENGSSFDALINKNGNLVSFKEVPEGALIVDNNVLLARNITRSNGHDPEGLRERVYEVFQKLKEESGQDEIWITEDVLAEYTRIDPGFAQRALPEGVNVIQTNVNRNSDRYQQILNTLQQACVGRRNKCSDIAIENNPNIGLADRRIIADILYSASSGNSVPNFATNDSGIYVRMCLLVSTCKALFPNPNQINMKEAVEVIVKEFPDGFDVSITGASGATKKIHIDPIGNNPTNGVLAAKASQEIPPVNMNNVPSELKQVMKDVPDRGGLNDFMRFEKTAFKKLDWDALPAAQRTEATKVMSDRLNTTLVARGYKTRTILEDGNWKVVIDEMPGRAGTFFRRLKGIYGDKMPTLEYNPAHMAGNEGAGGQMDTVSNALQFDSVMLSQTENGFLEFVKHELRHGRQGQLLSDGNTNEYHGWFAFSDQAPRRDLGIYDQDFQVDEILAYSRQQNDNLKEIRRLETELRRDGTTFLQDNNRMQLLDSLMSQAESIRYRVTNMSRASRESSEVIQSSLKGGGRIETETINGVSETVHRFGSGSDEIMVEFMDHPRLGPNGALAVQFPTMRKGKYVMNGTEVEQDFFLLPVPSKEQLKLFQANPEMVSQYITQHLNNMVETTRANSSQALNNWQDNIQPYIKELRQLITEINKKVK